MSKDDTPLTREQVAPEWRNCVHPECRLNCKCGWPDECSLAPKCPSCGRLMFMDNLGPTSHFWACSCGCHERPADKPAAPSSTALQQPEIVERLTGLADMGSLIHCADWTTIQGLLREAAAALSLLRRDSEDGEHSTGGATRNEALEEAAKVLDDGCAHCDGRGYTIGPVCCNRPLPSGECCQQPDPERIQCPDACHQAADAIRNLKREPR